MPNIKIKKPNNLTFEVLRLPPENTNSVLVSNGTDAVIFDAWGRVSDWEQVLSERGLNLRSIYTTHGHPDHISAAPALAARFNVDWFLNAADEYLILSGNGLLEYFKLPPIQQSYKKPEKLSVGTVEILPNVKMEILASPGHTPGGMFFYFPEYKILLVGDTLFQAAYGRVDLPGGDERQLFKSIHNLYDMNLDDNVFVVHGHGMETTIGWLKKNNPFFLSGKH